MGKQKEKVTEFQNKVYKLISTIPRGKVSTYGLVAKKLKSSPRAVGNALRENPFAPKVPCHRIVRGNLNIGGFRGEIQGKNIKDKLQLLQDEGVKIVNSDSIEESCLYAFDEE